MIIEECNNGSTLIKFDDRDINTKEESKVLNSLLDIISKKISEYY